MPERDALQLLLYRELTRGRSLDAETGPRAIMRELLAIAGGSVRKAAALAGVGKSTWYDWRKGKTEPSGESLRKLHATLPLRRRHRLPAGREKWLKAQPKIKITAWTVVKSTKGKKGDDVRHRVFKPGPYLPKGALAGVVDQFLAGEDIADVAAEFVRTIEEYYGGVIIDAGAVDDLEIVPAGRTFRDGDR